jgi:hypothetical protein
MKKQIIFLVFLAILSFQLFPFEIGLIGGTNNKPSELNLGVSGTMGFFIPFIKFEIEAYKIVDYEFKGITGGIKFRKKLGPFAPYVTVGIGTEFEELNFKFSEYMSFTYIGGGTHLYLMDMLSLRFDIRFQKFSDFNRTRFTGGLFLHL